MRKAFTLIELIFVIVIIGIVLAAVIPGDSLDYVPTQSTQSTQSTQHDADESGERW